MNKTTENTTEVKGINLITFGMEELGYAKEHMANNYFKKKFNEFWELGEDNNTGTKAEIMSFAKAKASKGSKLMDWYNPIIEELLADVFTDEVADIKRESYVYEPKKKATSKKTTEKKVGGTKNGEKLSKSDAEILNNLDIAQKLNKEEKK